MAAMGFQEASSTRYSYHVFLSFRGKDTRKTFTGHLYTALLHAGIRTFRDDDELGTGDDISSELIKAIEESRISIIVFSKDYASSTWCLDELLKILERKKSVGHIIVPVFYHVDPSDLRWLKGSFAEAFAKHEKRLELGSDERKEKGMDKIKRWKEALREVADLSGMISKDGYESNFIQEIVKEISNKLNRTMLSVCSYPVGLDSRINDINLWLQDGSYEVGIVAISGMRGIGKTTIAKTLYNLNFDRFEGSSFLAKVRETSEEPRGLVRLQKQLLSDILKGKKVKISSVDEGIIKIRDSICCKRILLILDDVNEQDQLNAVLIMRSWFQQGSKIIITTSNEQLLKAHELHKVHKVKGLTDDESFQLFSWHAFGQDHPIEGYMEHTENVVKYCGGLPLALQILGSSLSGRSVDVWESAIKKLEAIPDSQIITKLKISFDSLEGDHDKNLFLDIACFFVGMDQDFVITVLDGCEYYTKVGIDNLIKRCLVTVNIDNELTMHQLLRDMGREIVHRESPKEPSKRSRLCHHKDALNVLIEKTGTEIIEGLILNLHGSNSSERIGLGFFSWLPVTSTLRESFSTLTEVDLQTNAFSRMHNLRLLHLNNVRLAGNYKQFPKKLIWLCWCGFSLEIIPIEFSLGSVVVLDMQNSSLKQVWKGKKFLRSLKILNLSHSHCLTNTPDFSNVPNLERLILKDCMNLIEVHKSIGELGRLVLLDLKDCKNLRELPLEIGRLKSLEYFILSGCSKLYQFPRELGGMESLKMLHADGTAINQSLSTTTEVRSWLSYLWYWGSGPREIPEYSISFVLTSLPRSLTSLCLKDCNLSDDLIPRDLGNLSLLRQLDLSGNPIHSLRESIKGLTMLQSLVLQDCITLQSLPELPMSLQMLNLRNCRSLKMLINLPNWSSSLLVHLSGCEKLLESQRLYKLEPIGKIDTKIMSNLGLFSLEFLKNVKLAFRKNMPGGRYQLFPHVLGLTEFGIFNTYVPGSEVPSWYSFKSTGFPICFKVQPPSPNLKIDGMNVCVVYTYNPMAEFDSPPDPPMTRCSIHVRNRTKRMVWTYWPTVIGITGNIYTMWLSHWKIKEELQVDDEVEVSVVLIPFYVIKELGIHVVFREDAKGMEYYTVSTSPYCQNVDDADV
ncbi:disease resistance protein RUN1-like [Cornus florida]|uniref:disease resistance protein RUN1-like n=1 Tax=Cornus florida TaxID=4283 RepID=UPI0028999132|nr:disease resistance protein RUN1-like [Cornus florida]XP_059652141.1 disease resistance protein RUN1-like [Cornus florida]